MKFSLNLLKQFVKINALPEKLAELLTEHAFEVEDVAPTGGEFNLILAAKVISAEKHPNADRLRVIKLDVGGKIIEPVVCGAFNFGAGDIVALALPGATIAQNIYSAAHESFVLAKATIRGVESQGMICAEFELGLTKQPGDKPEIMLLNKSVKPGTPLNEALGLKATDYVLNCALPANRPDLHSHIGLAREIAAVTNAKQLVTRNSQLLKLKPSPKWKIIVKDKTHCPRYYGVRMKVKVGPSPKSIADVLTAVGMRPINNVVDITNFVMTELGNPTHAFDAKFVEGNIVVQNAKAGQKFTALNHKEYTLAGDTLMICDEKKNLGFAAIMGGKESEISSQTSEIILEVANFEPTGIRRTSKKLGLRTEGSAMWEKGVHPKLAELALARSIELLKKYAAAEIIEFAKFETPLKNPAAIKFKADDLNKLLGTNVSAKQIVEYLSRYRIVSKILNQKSKIINSAPPWWRTDVTTMPDLAEEVLKLYGYNKVKPLPLTVIPNASEGSLKLSITDDIYQTKSLFARLGYAEVQNYNFISEKDILKIGGDPRTYIEIANPLSKDQQYMRKSGLPALLSNASLNQKNYSYFKLFEVAKSYGGFEKEPLFLNAALFSKHAPVEKLLMQAKGDVLEFFAVFGHKKITFPSMNSRDLTIQQLDHKVGAVLPISKKLLEQFEIEGNLVFIKIELEPLFASKKDTIYESVGKYPTVQRDISVIVSQTVSWADVEKTVFGSKNHEFDFEISLFEAPFLTHDKDSVKFHQELLKQGKKNLGIRLLFKPKNRTLTDTEITGILDKIVIQLKQELKAEIR